MASFRKHGAGWRAEVFKRGVRRSKVFPTRQAAKEWAAREEYLIANAPEAASREPLSTLLDRYAREVSSKKRGGRWEQLRLARFCADSLGRIPIGELRAADFAGWREKRLAEVAPGTVRREMVLLSSVLGIARREWGLLKSNPMEGVRKPADPQGRERLPTDDELARLAVAAGSDLSTIIGRAFHAFRFAVETGMRAGEICRMAPQDLRGRVVHIPTSKNGTARDVPLSLEAVRLLQALPPLSPVFGLTDRQLDAQWRKLRDRAGVVGLTFHDSRHAAITRLSRRLDVLALARAVGHRDIRMLQRYYNESAEALAARLD